jgi:tetratricopeptide (TPR) repeat protein
MRRRSDDKKGSAGLYRHCLILFLLLTASGAATAAPFVPTDDAQVLEHVPDGLDSAGRELLRENAELVRNPANLDKAVAVARADIDRSRSMGDPRWLGRAEAVLAPWSAVETPPIPVLLLRAVILQSNHEFDTSLQDLEQVIQREPRNAQAWLTRASIDQVRANYPATIADCGQFANLSIGLVPDTCTAQIMALTGHAPLALRALSASLRQYEAEPAAVRAWALTAAAEIAERIGDKSAEQRFEAALAVAPDDPYLLGAWSDWLLDQGRPEDVVQLLRDKTRIDPLLLRLAIAEQELQSPDATNYIDDLAGRFEASHLRGESVHRREEARFKLVLQQKPAEALALATANWGVQREPADARILLEAALAAHRGDAAAPVLGWLHDNKLEDVRLTELAAQISSEPVKN